MGEKSPLELCKQLSGAPPLAVVAGLQRLQDAEEVVVADPLEFADGQASRLLVRLHGDLFDRRLVEVDDVCKFLAREALSELSGESRLAQGQLRPRLSDLSRGVCGARYPNDF
jgi:hypothetical protein